ncbi:MAG TPA: hypothetical protein VN655_04610 [Pseudolabrys sp.]|nr:hypothetical protein [Pseudolabrys sp.]
MRTGWSLSLAAGAVVLALLLTDRAGAVTMPGAAQLPEAAHDIGAVEQARTICRRWWNGYRWRTRCYWVPGHGYWAPRPWRRLPRE